jgi:uncharacterized membrane protein
MLTRLLLGTFVIAIVASPVAAIAKSFWISSADVQIVVLEDGSLDVIERITFDFDGNFSGAYRDIPLRPGESIENLVVSDASGGYSTGGCTQLGCSSPAGTYGVEVHPTFVRVVWHHDSRSVFRTFSLGYTMRGVASSYDDVVDVNLQVWGDQWAVGVDHLTAAVTIPDGATAGEVLVWGHPYGIEGSTSLGDDDISPSLTATDVPAERWVEIRTVFPTSLLDSRAGTRQVSGNGLESILAEETRFAEDEELSAQAGGIGLLIGAILLIAIAGGLGTITYLRYGKEPKVDYDREYEQEPPTDLSPAEVGALLSQGKVTEKEFTATLFDLIRQGAIDAAPTQVVKSTWAGMRTETISDLELSLGTKSTGLRDYEQSVMTVVKRVLDTGPRPLTDFRDEIREDARENATTYGVYKARVLDAIERSAMLDTSGNAAAVLTVIIAALIAGAGWLILPRVLENQPGGTAMAFLIVFGMILGVVLLGAVLLLRRVRV